jgi:large repetitive protein
MWFRTSDSPRAARPLRRSGARRLALEALHDRCVPATVSIGDATILEGDGGTQSAVLAVTLSGPVQNPPFSVHYSTASGSALAGTDYQAVSGTLTFNKGQTYKTISVPVVGDLVAESTETFSVNLTSPKHGTIADGQGVVTITDNDTRLNVNDVTLAEGQAGTTAFNFTVTLSTARTGSVGVDYNTMDYTAAAGSDYAGVSGHLTFAPGETSKTVTVLVTGERHFEPDEAFYVTLSGATNALIDDAYGMGTILNDDVQINIGGGGAVTEGDDGTTDMTFTVTLSGPSDAPVTVDYATADGTASAGSDYAAVSAHLTFAPGETSKSVTVPVNGDSTLEFNEDFLVNLSNAAGADVGAGSAAGSILNDDGPIVSIDDVWNYEGSSGTSTFYAFTVRLSQPATEDIVLDFATVDGWAVAGVDYVPTSGTLTIKAGDTTATIVVEVLGDDYYEGDESFSVSLNLVSGTALVQPGGGTGTIGDDDYYYDPGWYYDPGYGYGY